MYLPLWSSSSLCPPAFNVQTLRRNLKTRDGQTIRNAAHGMFVLGAPPIPSLAAAIAIFGKRLSKPFADRVIHITLFIIASLGITPHRSLDISG
jgi:hypothetical protein